MPEDRVMSNAALRILLEAVEEVMGKNGTHAILNASKLSQYIDNYPEKNDEMGTTFGEYGLVEQSIEDFYGPRGARAMMLRIGRATFQYGINEQPAALGLVGVALKAIPEKRRMKMILEKMASAAGEILNQPSHVVEEEDAYYYIQDECPCHWRPPHDKPCCYVTVGALTEAMAWTTGKVFKVEEMACISNGATNCVYRVPKEAQE
ncbi:MAG: hypothetical protein AAF485_05405 [Chloroflexota bacterium]